MNLYAYCGNDSINKYDPTGHSAILIGLIIGTIGIVAGVASIAFGIAEIQEGLGYGNWINDIGISGDLYTGLYVGSGLK